MPARSSPLHAHRGIDAEPTGTLPAEHAEGVGLIEQLVRADVPQDTTLDDALEAGPVLGLEEGRFVEASLALSLRASWPPPATVGAATAP